MVGEKSEKGLISGQNSHELGNIKEIEGMGIDFRGSEEVQGSVPLSAILNTITSQYPCT